MRISLIMMVIVLSMEALSFSGCGEGTGGDLIEDEYKITHFVTQDGTFAAWVEWEGKRYRASLEGDMVVYEEVQ
jgi:hypothetical protein